MRVKLKITGLQDLAATLRGVTAAAYLPASFAAMEEATTAILTATREKAPTKELRRGLGRKVKEFKKGVGVYGVVGVKKGRRRGGIDLAALARLKEFGTQNQGPQPFMRPGWDESQAKAKGLVKSKLTAATKEASRTRKGKR